MFVGGYVHILFEAFSEGVDDFEGVFVGLLAGGAHD